MLCSQAEGEKAAVQQNLPQIPDQPTKSFHTVSRFTRTQGHPWFRLAGVQVHGVVSFTGFGAGPAPVSSALDARRFLLKLAGIYSNRVVSRLPGGALDSATINLRSSTQ